MAFEQQGVVSGSRPADRMVGGVRWRVIRCASVGALLALAGLAGSCSDTGGVYSDAQLLVAEESSADYSLDDAATVVAERDLHNLGRSELRDGPAVQRLGIARLLSEVGVLGLLESYIVNIPTGAYFLPLFELQAAMSASRLAHGSTDAEAGVMRDFERSVLIAHNGAALNRLPAPSGPDPLHDAFFEVFERCGGDSPWPDVPLLERNRENSNAAGDVLYLSPDLGISLYEYRELLHVCARYAATYPTLEPAVRDELLAPQRAYFSRGILDRIDNEMPRVEVPSRYQAEVDELREEGW